MSWLLYGFIDTYILFSDTAEKENDVSLWGFN